jgi:hypothetical protein
LLAGSVTVMVFPAARTRFRRSGVRRRQRRWKR